jgi:DNA-binding NarL/FixJ family response regulator
MTRAICAAAHQLTDVQVIGTACTGPEALQQLRAQQPDLVLLDLLLPGPSGLETARLIRKDYPRVKIIVVTALGPEMIAAARSAGSDGFVQKRSLPDGLQSEIHRVLNSANAASAAPSLGAAL